MRCHVGNSISLSDQFGDGENVCSVNAQGVGNGYIVSTYSLPDAVLAPNGSEGSIYLSGEHFEWRLCAVRWWFVLQQHRGCIIPGLQHAAYQ